MGIEGIPGDLVTAFSTFLTSPALGAWEEGEVATGGGGVTAIVLLLTQAGRGAGLALVTPGPLSPRFSQVLSFLGGRNWREGVRNLVLISQAIRPSNSSSSYERLPPATLFSQGQVPRST